LLGYMKCNFSDVIVPFFAACDVKCCQVYLWTLCMVFGFLFVELYWCWYWTSYICIEIDWRMLFDLLNTDLDHKIYTYWFWALKNASVHSNIMPKTVQGKSEISPYTYITGKTFPITEISIHVKSKKPITMHKVQR